MVQQALCAKVVMSQTPSVKVFWMRQQRPFQGDPWDKKDNKEIPRQIPGIRGTRGTLSGR
jgi:hypothetical protein